METSWTLSEHEQSHLDPVRAQDRQAAPREQEDTGDVALDIGM